MKYKSPSESKLNRFFDFVEHAISSPVKILIGTLALVAFGLALSPLFEKNDMTASSVMITNMAGTSGGSGVIYRSTPTESKVLTNSHVCRVIEHGGLVSGRSGSFLVSTYKHSQVHDLCMITVDTDLGYNTKVASRPPVPYYERATISGYPALLPVTRTTGHFSGHRVIEVMTGMRPCSSDDLKDPIKALFCLSVGGLPEFKRYDATFVTATIMPGSSGSGVYNSDDELSGLAFAGQGNLGYAWAVPYEALHNFIYKEEEGLFSVKPSATVELFSDSAEKKGFDEAVSFKKMKTACSGPDSVKYKDICVLINQDEVWYK